MPVGRERLTFVFGGALLAVAAIVAAVGSGGPSRPARGEAHHDAPSPSFVRFVPGLASDSAGRNFDSSCVDDVYAYLRQPGALRVVRNSTIASTETRLLVLEFTNPCPSAIVPPVINLSIADGGDAIEATAGGFPSIIEPGERGYFTALWYTATLNGPSDPELEVTGPQDVKWDELIATARALTVDANGNDANAPDFDAGSIALFGESHRWSVVAHADGKPPAWPPYLWLAGTCADGTFGIGRFFPDAYGYNPADTTFEGFTSWLDCEPSRPSMLGPAIDDLWMGAVVGAPQNTVLLDDLTLEQTLPGTFRLTANAINTNAVPGRPSAYSFVLNKAAGPPLQFTVAGSEVWFPGVQGSLVINNIPGNVDDFTSASGQASGTVAVPGRPVAGWELPPTIVWSDGTASGPYASLVVVPNAEALKEALGAESFTYRKWLQERDGVVFRGTGSSFPVGNLTSPFTEQLPLEDVFPGLDDRIAEIEASFAARTRRLTTGPSVEPP